jgi:hypothetical protein
VRLLSWSTVRIWTLKLDYLPGMEEDFSSISAGNRRSPCSTHPMK